MSHYLLLGLPDHLNVFQRHFVFQRETVGYFHGRPQGGKIGIFSLGNWDYEANFSRKPDVNSLIHINCLYSCNICQHDTRGAQVSGSLFWCHAVMSLQSTHVRSFACRSPLPNLRADCSTVGLYCATITLHLLEFT